MTAFLSVLAPDVLEKMEEHHILREDAVRVVRHAEASGDTFLNRDNGHFLASLRPCAGDVLGGIQR